MSNVYHIKGEGASRRVWINGLELTAWASQKVWNHSPDGFNWGYGGSGPAQLALAICLSAGMSRDEAVARHQDFKWERVQYWQGDFEVTLTCEEIVGPVQSGDVVASKGATP